jgi:hypothetical protein
MDQRNLRPPNEELLELTWQRINNDCQRLPNDPILLHRRNIIYSDYINHLKNKIQLLCDTEQHEACIPICYKAAEIANVMFDYYHDGISDYCFFMCELSHVCIKLVTNLQTMENNDDIAKPLRYLQILARCLRYSAPLIPKIENSAHYQKIVTVHKTFLNTLAIQYSKYLAEQSLPVNMESLIRRENFYLITINLLRFSNNRDAIAITFAELTNVFKAVMLNNFQYITRESLDRMYEHTCKAIEFSLPNPPPRTLYITDIFEMYAKNIQEVFPTQAIQIYRAALAHRAHNCQNPHSIYYCLRGLATCYLKCNDSYYQSITEENAEAEIDANLQFALKYSIDAFNYLRAANITTISAEDCIVAIVTLNRELGRHYEHFPRAFYPHLKEMIIDRYQEAIQWAFKTSDQRIAAESYSQLANFYDNENDYISAEKCWEEAIAIYTADLKCRATQQGKFIEDIKKEEHIHEIFVTISGVEHKHLKDFYIDHMQKLIAIDTRLKAHQKHSRLLVSFHKNNSVATQTHNTTLCSTPSLR